jgi:catechol 2,3-dioxygenase-like lactoylglutathione lyase family enzyme
MQLHLKHDHVGLSTIDIDATIDWYTSALDFTVERRFEANGMTFAFLVNDNVKLELMHGARENVQPEVTDVYASLNHERLHHFCVALDDVDAAVEELRSRGVNIVGGPFDVPPINQRIAFITDNSGNIIEITSPGTSA